MNKIFKTKEKLPEGWQWVELGKLCQKVYTVKRKEKALTDIFFYLDIGGIDNLSNIIVAHKEYNWQDAPSRAQQIVYKNDILFSTVRTYMKNIALINNEIYDGQIASSGFCVIRGSKEIIFQKFIFYYVISEGFLRPLNELQTGSSYPAVRDKDVFAQLFPLPPKEVQKNIVSKIEELFSELDKGIENMRTAQQQLKIYRQAVLKWAFEGKLTNQNVKEGVLLKGWKNVVLGDVCKNVQYGSATKSKLSGKIPVLRMGNIQNGKLDWSDLVYTEDEEEIKKYLLKKGDVLFNRTNSAEWVGKTAIYKGERPAIFAGYLIRINRIEDLLDPNFITYYLNSLEAKKYGNSIRSFGVNQSNINGTKLKAYPLYLPPIVEQIKIVQEIESRLSVADKMEESIIQSLQQAEALRQSIFKKAFEGKLV